MTKPSACSRIVRFASSISFAVLGLLALTGSGGCDGERSAPVVSPPGGRASEYLLTTQPSDPASLTQTAEELSGAEGSPSEPNAAREVVLIGKIDAGDFPAFQDGQATFMLSELPAAGHGLDDPDHEDNCPFCKRRAEQAPKAIVSIVDPDGNAVKTDARELLGVAQGDRVIAVGTATYDKSVNAITLQCSGVYVGK